MWRRQPKRVGSVQRGNSRKLRSGKRYWHVSTFRPGARCQKHLFPLQLLVTEASVGNVGQDHQLIKGRKRKKRGKDWDLDTKERGRERSEVIHHPRIFSVSVSGGLFACWCEAEPFVSASGANVLFFDTTWASPGVTAIGKSNKIPLSGAKKSLSRANKSRWRETFFFIPSPHVPPLSQIYSEQSISSLPPPEKNVTLSTSTHTQLQSDLF